MGDGGFWPLISNGSELDEGVDEAGESELGTGLPTHHGSIGVLFLRALRAACDPRPTPPAIISCVFVSSQPAILPINALLANQIA